jgi:hypothetical protein
MFDIVVAHDCRRFIIHNEFDAGNQQRVENIFSRHGYNQTVG